MADNDNKELMGFLERQFEGIYKRLENTATKDDLKAEITAVKDDLANFATKDDLKAEIAAAKDELRADIEDVKRHTGVLNEAVQHKLDLLVEGRVATRERMEMDREENAREHARLEKMTLINTADISTLDRRVGKLEGKA